MSSLGLKQMARSVSLTSILLGATYALGAGSAGCATAEGDGIGSVPRPDSGAADTSHPDTGAVVDTGGDTAPKPDAATDTATAPDTSTGVDSGADGSDGSDGSDAATGPEGDTCANATVVTLDASGNATLIGQTTAGYAEDYSASAASCRAGIAADRVYAIKVPAGKRLTAKVTPTDLNFDPALNLVLPATGTNCGAGECVVTGVDSGLDGDPDSIRWMNDKGAETTIYLVVDSRQSDSTSQGDYDLDVSVGDQPAGESCADPKVLSPSGSTMLTLAGETLSGFANDYGAGTTCSGTAGPDRVYAIDVPANQRLTVSAKPASWDLSLNIQDSATCGVTPRVCMLGTDAGSSGTAETLKYTNTTGATKSLRVVVESYSSSTFGDYDLSVQLSPLPTNDRCDAAIAVPAAGTITGDTTAASSDYTGGTNCAGTAGPDLVYSVEVPAGKQLAATILGTTSGFAPALDVVDSAACGSAATRSCLGGVSTTSASPAGTVRWTNAGTAAKTVNLVVDSTTATGVGAFSISVVFSDPPAGDTCANPFTTLLTDGSVVSDTTVGATNDYATGSGCGGAAGPDKVYAVTIPPGKILSTTVLGTGGFAPSISYQSALQCSSAPRVCSGGLSTSAATPTGTLRYANESSSAPETLYVVLDSTATAGGTYSLTASLSDVGKAGDVCGSAEVITAGTNVTGLTTVGYANEYEGGTVCKAAPGPDRVFAVTVPDGKQLTALITPDAAFDPTLSLIAGTPASCAAHVCNASVDAKGAGQPETATYSNRTGADQVVYVVIDSVSTTSSSSGTFSLLTALTDVTGGGGTGATGGETCDAAPTLALGPTPVTISGDFLGYANDYTYANAGSCSWWTGPDMAWGVTIPAGKQITATLTHSITSNPYMSLLLGTSSSCLGLGSCAKTTIASSPSGTLTYTNTSGADVSGFLILDLAASSATVSTSTPFSLSIQTN